MTYSRLLCIYRISTCRICLRQIVNGPWHPSRVLWHNGTMFSPQPMNYFEVNCYDISKQQSNLFLLRQAISSGNFMLLIQTVFIVLHGWKEEVSCVVNPVYICQVWSSIHKLLGFFQRHNRGIMTAALTKNLCWCKSHSLKDTIFTNARRWLQTSCATISFVL